MTMYTVRYGFAIYCHCGNSFSTIWIVLQKSYLKQHVLSTDLNFIFKITCRYCPLKKNWYFLSKIWFEFHFQNNLQILSSKKNFDISYPKFVYDNCHIQIFVEVNMFTVLYSLNPYEILYYCSFRLKFKMFRFPMNYIWLFSNVMIYHNVWWNGLFIHLTI